MPEAEPIIPAWLALTAGSLALVALAGHLLALNSATDMDARRRRIRMANAVLMMLVVPFVVYGFGVAVPSRARAYVYVWVITGSMLVMIILVALLDVLNSWQMHRAQLRELRRHIAETRGARGLAVAAGGHPIDEKPRDAPGR